MSIAKSINYFGVNTLVAGDFSGRLLQKNVSRVFYLAMSDGFPKRTTINSHSIKVVGRYCETDQGGVIHHSVFPIWFEMGRTELLRANGMAYKDLEKAGVFFVIAELNVKYRRPAFYDENLTLETTCTQVTAARINHSYKLTREDGLILTQGSTVLACIDNEGKPRRIPSFFLPEIDL